MIADAAVEARSNQRDNSRWAHHYAVMTVAWRAWSIPRSRWSQSLAQAGIRHLLGALIEDFGECIAATLEQRPVVKVVCDREVWLVFADAG
jgi:hypothetical protein